jgi:hypothetical protein
MTTPTFAFMLLVSSIQDVNTKSVYLKPQIQVEYAGPFSSLSIPGINVESVKTSSKGP